MATNYRKIYAIKKMNEKRILDVCPDMKRKSGIYFYTRTDENGISYFYIGQSVDCLERSISHLTGYQLRNVSLGGQGENRASGSIGDRKAPKGYMQGIQQGRKNLARELSSIAEKHLKIEIKDDKKQNKVSQKQYEKFMDLLNNK